MFILPDPDHLRAMLYNRVLDQGDSSCSETIILKGNMTQLFQMCGDNKTPQCHLHDCEKKQMVFTFNFLQGN